MSTRKKASRTTSKTLDTAAIANFGTLEPAALQSTAVAPARAHSASYHWPLLLSDKKSCDALLKWFEGIEDERSMPWRKKWIDAAAYEGKQEELSKVLAKRAYEVWVSEIMLQQTRVSTVVPYFKTWIAKWPTVEDLAKAQHDEVLSVWKGLGYYSRATRLHQGAKNMVSKNRADCLIPSSREELEKVSGIGPYTAGAVSSIAFGEPEAVLDGNVARVLSRQLGVYAYAKDKKITDLFWKVADRLVKHASGFPITKKSAVPGQWNQALMELGSTICTPRPKCKECPIRKTCRAYAEGEILMSKAQVASDLVDIEDACNYCEELSTEDLMILPEGEDEDTEKKGTKKRKKEVKNTKTISLYFAPSTPTATLNATSEDTESSPVNGSRKRKAPEPSAESKSTASYCSLFPKKIVKKQVAEEECVVCIIELRILGDDSKWLIEQRPAKGLLASLWQFPQSTISSGSSASTRRTTAQRFVSSLDVGQITMSGAEHVSELKSLLHVFTHLKLTMHVHLFVIDADTVADTELACAGPPKRKWVDSLEIGVESLSTGMQKCWKLVSETVTA